MKSRNIYRPKIYYFNNGKISTITYVKNDILHKEDGPAFIKYQNVYNNKKLGESYWKNGILHREDGPAVIEYYNGITKLYIVNGLIHRENGPAELKYDRNGNLEEIYWYYKDIEYTNKVKKWLRDNKRNWRYMKEDDFNRMWMEIL